MKFLLLSFLMMSLTVYSQNWEEVGGCCVTSPNNSGNNNLIHHAETFVTSTGEIYTCEIHLSRVDVYQLENNGWELLATKNKQSWTGSVDIEMYNDSLYFVFSEHSSFEAFKLVGGSFNQLGSTVSSFYSAETNLILDNNGKPYFVNFSEKLYAYNGTTIDSIYTFPATNGVDSFYYHLSPDNSATFDVNNNLVYVKTIHKGSYLKSTVSSYDGVSESLVGDTLHDSLFSGGSVFINQASELIITPSINSAVKTFFMKLNSNVWTIFGDTTGFEGIRGPAVLANVDEEAFFFITRPVNAPGNDPNRKKIGGVMGNNNPYFYLDTLLVTDYLNIRDIDYNPTDQRLYVTYITGNSDNKVHVVKSTLALNVPEIAKAEISIYPNPVLTHLHFDSNDLLPNSIIEVYNIAGRLVLTSNVVGDNLDVSSLVTGAYLGIIKNPHGKLRFKFIKE